MQPYAVSDWRRISARDIVVATRESGRNDGFGGRPCTAVSFPRCGGGGCE